MNKTFRTEVEKLSDQQMRAIWLRAVARIWLAALLPYVMNGVTYGEDLEYVDDIS